MKVETMVRDFLAELRRRRVVRVVIVYAIVAWAMVQVAATVGPALALPDWTDSLVVLIALVGFPLAVVLAWAYDLTPEGVRRPESEASGGTSPGGAGGRPATAVSRSRSATRSAARAEGARPRPSARPALPEPGPVELRRAMLATLRHELRTPLNAVIGYSEFLLEDLPPERSAPVKAILTAGQKNLTLVNEILRPDTADEELTDENLAGMRRRIREEMSAPTERLVQLCQEARTAVGDAPEIAIEDIDRLTEASIRLRDLVRSEVAAVDTEDGAGATTGPTRELAARVIAGLPRAAQSAGDSPPRHGQILVVDDNADNRDLLSRQLAREGFSISLAPDGESALAALREQNFDLVLLDVLMPGLDGIEVLAQMQRDPVMAEIPVIMTSALDEIEGVVRCIEQGAVDYLTKPFDPVLLQARIAATLDLHRLRAQQRRASQDLEEEIAWSDRLIRSLVPAALSERVRDGRGTLIEEHASVTVLTVSIQGLGTFAARHGATALAEWLNEAMTAFEARAEGLPLRLHWEGGATLMATTGTAAEEEERPEAIAELALRLRDEAEARSAEPLRVGIGIHSGSAVSALVDAEHVVYGIWGEAPDVAREIASRCPAGAAHVSPAAYAALHEAFDFEARGIMETASRTQMRVYALLRRREAPAGQR